MSSRASESSIPSAPCRRGSGDRLATVLAPYIMMRVCREALDESQRRVYTFVLSRPAAKLA